MRILTRNQPLGPPYTEELLRSPRGIFEQLYDRMNGCHGRAERDDPVYVVGRKGSGKTAFLVGTAFVDGAKVILIKSEDAYHEIERLRIRYAREVGPLFAENLAHVWQVLLTHAAMLLSCRVPGLRHTGEGRLIASYLSSYGNPSSLEPGRLLARVGSALSDVLVRSIPGLTVEEMCASLRTDVATYEVAHRSFVDLIERERVRLYVVVDNLEDLHVHVAELRTTLSGLFRATREFAGTADAQPFKVRFAFPAELVQRLRDLTANPEKDFLDYLVIRWTAAELMTIAGNRLRRYLDLYHQDDLGRLGLPRQHDERDHQMAEATLRSLLPRGGMRTGLGSDEDPVAYIMRHTQLLPRHLIQILNEILSRSARHRRGVPVATPGTCWTASGRRSCASSTGSCPATRTTTPTWRRRSDISRTTSRTRSRAASSTAPSTPRASRGRASTTATSWRPPSTWASWASSTARPRGTPSAASRTRSPRRCGRWRTRTRSVCTRSSCSGSSTGEGSAASGTRGGSRCTRTARTQGSSTVTDSGRWAYLDGGHEGRSVLGISFSGGGIRSAAFCLGAYQALSRQGLFQRARYLSAVSGGSYIAGALTVAQGKSDAEALRGEAAPWSRGSPEEWYLRTHLSYLAPGLTGRLWLVVNFVYGLLL